MMAAIFVAKSVVIVIWGEFLERFEIVPWEEFLELFIDTLLIK